MLFISIVVASAQQWNYVGDNYSGTEHAVLVGLVDANGNALSYTENDGLLLGAFIGDECRGQQNLVVQSGVSYFPMRIKGTADDNGKPVTFRLWKSGGEYLLTGDQSLTYANETEANYPSNLFKLKFVEPTSFTVNKERISVNVGEQVELLPLIEWTPANANVPMNIDWNIGNYATFMKVENNVLYGLSPNKNMEISIWTTELIKEPGTLTVDVIQPITSLTLKEEYANEQTIFVNQFAELTEIMNNCYTVEPANSNEDLVWSWEPESAFTETFNQETQSIEWNPNTSGHYKLVLKGGSHSITLPLYVMNHVERITPKLDYINLFVGDNLSDLLPYAYDFTPSQDINKEVEYEIYKNDDGLLAQDENGTITAVKAGDSPISLIVKSVESPNATCELYVFVHPNITGVTVKNDNLAFEYTDTEIDITEELFANFSFTPDATYKPIEREIYSENIDVCTISYDQANAKWSAKALALGNASIIINHSAERTTLSDGELSNKTVTASSKFLVSVTQGLKFLSCDTIIMGRNQIRTITLKPIPETANVDPSKVMVKVVVNNDFTGWQLASAESQDETGLKWTISPEAIGNGYIRIYYDKVEFGSANITIGQSFEQKEGWAWVTPYGGTISDIEALYGDALQEMRSQKYLLFNDPVYGYFGQLTTMELTQGYKVNIKTDKYVNNFNRSTYPYDALKPSDVEVSTKWNWIGAPYQFDQPITDALKATRFTQGDRIVSKDSGFAEFDGSAWTGTLTAFVAGEGYLFYNAASQGITLTFASEESLGKPIQTDQVRAMKHQNSVWEYDATRFSDNMTIVADLGEDFADERYTIGAFINGECRGEGSYVDGKWFITVHGDAASNGQPVSFQVYDSYTSDTFDVENTQSYSQMAGSLSNPVVLVVPGTVTGVESINIDSINPNAKYYTIDGLEVTNPTSGLYIVVDGNKARKVYLK